MLFVGFLPLPPPACNQDFWGPRKRERERESVCVCVLAAVRTVASYLLLITVLPSDDGFFFLQSFHLILFEGCGYVKQKFIFILKF